MDDNRMGDGGTGLWLDLVGFGWIWLDFLFRPARSWAKLRTIFGVVGAVKGPSETAPGNWRLGEMKHSGTAGLTPPERRRSLARPFVALESIE
jgi:hypothetical protein